RMAHGGQGLFEIGPLVEDLAGKETRPRHGGEDADDDQHQDQLDQGETALCAHTAKPDAGKARRGMVRAEPRPPSGPQVRTADGKTPSALPRRQSATAIVRSDFRSLAFLRFFVSDKAGISISCPR